MMCPGSFLSGEGATLLAEVEHMAIPAIFHGGSGGHAPPGKLIVLGVVGHILVHSEAYGEAHRASGEETYLVAPDYCHCLLRLETFSISYMCYTECMHNACMPSGHVIVCLISDSCHISNLTLRTLAANSLASQTQPTPV